MNSSQTQVEETGRVLIIGASVRAAAESARKAGWSIVASDIFGDTDLLSIAEFAPIESYPEGFAAAVREVDLPTIYTGGLENYPSILDSIGTLWGNRGEPLLRARDPFWWTPRLSSIGFETAMVRRYNEPPQNNAAFLSKPFAGAAGHGVCRWNPDSAIGPDRFFQEYADGELLSAVFLGACDNCMLCGVTRQIVRSQPNVIEFGYAGSVGPIALPPPADKQVRRLGRFFSSEAGLRGLFGIDFVLRHNGAVAPIEVNPRYPASAEVLEANLTTSLLAAHRAAIEGDRFELNPTATNQFTAKLIAYAQASTQVEPGFNRQILPEGVRLADIPSEGTRIETGQPICTLLASADNVATAHDLAINAVNLLHPKASTES